MAFKNLRRWSALAPVLASVVLVMGSARSASADVTCTQELGACYQRAAGIANFWDRTAYALDCELGYAHCVVELFEY